LHLFVSHKRALRPHEFRGSGGREKHVAAADEGLGAFAVNDGAGIDLGRDLEGDARGQVRLDDTSDDIDRRALGGDDQVDAGGPG
jgi:hypothetical protein